LGKSLIFKWNLIAQIDPANTGGQQDYGFVSLSGPATFFSKLATIQSPLLVHDNPLRNFQWETGWHDQTVSYTFNTVGTYTLGFGVTAVGGFDNEVTGFMVDNVSIVPEPGAWTALAGCALGLFCVGRRLRRSRAMACA
jgi:hypothetical protein